MTVLTEEPLPYPGVSTKQIFLSKTVSPRLFLLARIRESSRSDHHSGYGFVLAYISVIWDVTLSALDDLDLLLREFERGTRDIC